MTVTTVGTTFVVSQDLGVTYDYGPSATVLSNGNYAVIWYNPAPSSFAAVVGRVIAPNGAFVTPDFVVAPSTSSYFYDSLTAITATASGGFAAAWYVSGSTPTIKFNFFDADGNALGSSAQVTGFTPALTLGTNGSVYLSDSAYNSSQTGQLYTLTQGQAAATSVNFSDPGGSDDIAALSNGKIAVVRVLGFGGFSHPLVGELYDPATNTVGATFQIAPDGNNSNPQVAALVTGGFVAAYDHYDGSGSNHTIAVRLVDASGSPVGSAVTIATTPTNDQGFPQVAALASGRFVVLWQDYNGSWTLHGQVFEANGVLYGNQFTIGQATGLNGSFSVAASGNNFLVTWMQFGAIDGQFYTVFTPNLTVVSAGQTVNNVILNLDDELDVFGTANNTTVNNGGYIYALSGGTTNSTTVFQGGTETVSAGGTAIGSIVNSGGIENVLSGGIASSTTVNNGGLQSVSFGGAASATIVNNGGEVVVNGSVVNTIVNSGGIEVTSGFGTINGATINNGGSVVAAIGNSIFGNVVDNGALTFQGGGIFAGTLTGNGSVTIFGIPVASGPSGFILNGGNNFSGTITVDGATLELTSAGAGGSAPITFVNASGGLRIDGSVMPTNVINGFARGNTIDLANVSFINGASAQLLVGNVLRISEGGNNYDIHFNPAQNFSGQSFLVFPDDGGGTDVTMGQRIVISVGQTVSNTAVAFGNFLDVFGTGLNTTVSSGGYESVYSAGSAGGTSVASGGQEFVFFGGTASGTVLNGGHQTVMIGATATNTTVNGGRQDVYGTANTNVLSGIGSHQEIHAGGVASGTAVGSGTFQIVDSGGTATDTSVNGNAWVYAGGLATGTTVNNHGFFDIGFIGQAGGSAVNTTVNSGGSMEIFSGGVATTTTVASGGSQVVNAGGTANGTTLNGGTQSLLAGTASATVINNGGYLQVFSGGAASAVTINSGGIADVMSGGTAAGTTVNNGGEQDVHLTGLATGTIVNSGGTEFVYSAGTTNGSTVNNGGHQNVYSGGIATGTTVGSGGFQSVFSAGVASGATINNGGEQDVHLTGLANDTIVNSGGYQYVFSGGTAVGTIENAGAHQQVYSGGIASGTIVNANAFQNVFSGGIASGTIIGSGGTEYVFSGGTINGAVISGGMLEIGSGGSTGAAPIAFASTSGTLKIDVTAMPSNMISGFAKGDIIDLAGVNFVSGGSATVQAGNILQVVVNSITYQLHLDPAQDFTGKHFMVFADTAGGSSVAYAIPMLVSVAPSAPYTENAPAVTLTSSLSVVDSDHANLTGATIAIIGGTFANDGDVLAATVTGTAITASYNSTTETLTLSGTDTLAHYQQVLRGITFSSSSDNPTNYGSNSTRNLTWSITDGDDVSPTVTTAVTITAVNDAPILSAVAASAPFTENGNPIILSSSLAVTDPDNVNLAGATVTITSGKFSGDGDVLAAIVAGTSITASYNASTETLTLSGSDTLAHYQQVLNSVSYTTSSDNPTNYGANATRMVSWVLDDGSAANNLSTSGTTTINVSAANDAPVLANVAASAAFTENGSPIALAPSLSMSDLDNQNLAGATIAITAGTFANDGDVLAATVTGTLITASYNSATETLTLSGSDTLAHYQQVLGSVTFSNTGDNPSNFGANPTRIVSWVVNDGSGSNNLSTAATTTINLTVANDAPVLANVTANVPFTENGSAVLLASGLTLTDADTQTLVGATVTITGGKFAGDGDVLAANVSGTAITANYDSSAEKLTLTGADSAAHYQQVLDSVTFVTASDNPTNSAANPNRVVTWVVDDGNASNNLSLAATTTVNIGAVNDAPTLASVATTVVSAAGQAVTLSPGLLVGDADNSSLIGATVAITGGTFANDGDLLATSTAGTSISASYNSGTETLTLSGTDTLAHYQQVLDAVTFSSSSVNPTNSGANSTRNISWTLNDGGAANNLSLVATTTVKLTALTYLTLNDPLAPPGGGSTYAFGINATGHVVGYYTTNQFTTVGHSYLYSGGSFTTIDDPLGTQGTFAQGINNNDQIVGFYKDGGSTYHGFIYSGGSYTTVDHPLGVLGTYATGINDSGQIVGYYQTGNGRYHGFLYSGGTFTTLDDPLAVTAFGNGTYAQGINASGQVVGYYNGAGNLTHAFLYSGGSFTTIDDPLATTGTFAYGINSSGQIAGWFTNGTGNHGFSDTAGNFTTLNGPLGGVIHAQGLNAAGQIVGSYTDGTINRGFLASPTPLVLNTGNAAASYAENGTAVAISPNLSVLDWSSSSLVGATVAVTGGTFANDGDVLTAATAGTSISASYNSSTEILTLSGTDTLAHYQQVLDSVTFMTSSDNPTNFGANTSRILTLVVDDGNASNNISQAATATVNIIAANDAPVVAIPTADRQTLETIDVNFQIPANAFTDADSSVLTYSATLGNGAQLPSWLHFDPATRVFSGTPPLGSAAALDIRLAASDGLLSTFDTFTLTVVAVPPNQSFSTTENSSLDVFPTGQNVVGGGIFVSAVNGSPSAVDHTITLPSGAHLTFNSDLSFVYEPNGVFDSLPGANSGASNLTAADSFTFTLNNGPIVTTTLTVAGADSNDLLLGTSGVDTLNGGIGSDALFGGDSNDTLFGDDLGTPLAASGNDILDGGPGSDTMMGRLGNDTYFVDMAGDVVTENANEGNDTVKASINYTLPANVENLVLTAGAGPINGTGNGLNNTLTGNTSNNILDGASGVDTVDYSSTALGINVNLATNQATGSEIGTDQLLNIQNVLGGSGNDSITGNSAANVLIGGAGNDMYFVDSVSDTVVESPNQGNDIVYATFDYTIPTNVESVVLQGSGNVNAAGNGQDNALIGNSGNNALDGKAGDDYMVGGLGNDIYYIDSAGDRVVESPNEGNDIAYATFDYTLGANVDSVVLIEGSGNINAAGSNEVNALIGNSGNNNLDGKGGDDFMVGGAGNDIYYVDAAGDRVVENPNEGNDIVYATFDYTLGANVESVVLVEGAGNINAAGSDDQNALIGNSGNNALDGKGGADYMVGGDGNDIYYVETPGDTVVENSNLGGGNNDIVHALFNYTLPANVEALVLDGSANLNGNGNGIGNAVIGNSGDNIVDGRGGADFLRGNAGNDTFRFQAGEAGGDTIADFDGNGSLPGDSLLFLGYGAGATFTNVDATHWMINYAGGSLHETITLQNSASIHPSDFSFV